MKLVQVRACDGQCCLESPRFPNADRSDCVYHVENRCELMRDPSKIPEGGSPDNPNYSAVDTFILTCKQWPDNTPPNKQKPKNNGGCCQQWIE